MSSDPGPLPITVDGEEAYQVRELLNLRRRRRILQYLVNYKRYGLEERSLVNADDILDPNLWGSSNTHIRIVWPLGHVGDPCVAHLFMPGAACRDGAMSQCQTQWFPLPAIRGLPQLNMDCYAITLHFP